MSKFQTLLRWPPLLLAFSLPAASIDQVTGNELEELRARIQEMTTQLNQVKSAYDVALEKLRVHELDTGALVRELRTTQQAMLSNSEELDALVQQMAAERATLARQRHDLHRQMRLTYGLARQDALKLVLNVEDFRGLSRILTYHVLAQREQVARIAAVRASIDRLDRMEARAVETRAALAKLRDQRSDALNTLREHQQTRTKLVAKLKLELASGAEELDRLRQNEETLSQLLAGLREELAEIPLPTKEIKRFSDLKGALPWPTSGPLLNRFGTSRPEGNLTWQGVLIGAGEGVPVTAISHGRVAFADWFRGFGLLLIVDHGDGYMSLYGRNESLFKEVGEWVSAGEQIAVIGHADATGPAALYFEIRHNGVPENPSKWCRGGSLVSG